MSRNFDNKLFDSRKNLGGEAEGSKLKDWSGRILMKEDDNFDENEYFIIRQRAYFCCRIKLYYAY